MVPNFRVQLSPERPSGPTLESGKVLKSRLQSFVHGGFGVPQAALPSVPESLELGSVLLLFRKHQ